MAFNFIKKVLLMAFVMIALSVQGFSAIHNITSCPSSLNDGDTYLMQDNFVMSATPCFVFNTTNTNVVVDGQNHEFDFGTSLLRVDYQSEVGGNTIQNLNITSNFQIRPRFGSSGGITSTGLTLDTIYIKDNNVPFIKSYAGGTNSGTSYMDNYNILNSVIRANGDIFIDHTKSTGIGGMNNQNNVLRLENWNIDNSEIIGFSSFGVGNCPESTRCSSVTYGDNNPMSNTMLSTFSGSRFSKSGSATCNNLFTNVFRGDVASIDADVDGLSDTPYVEQVSSCIYQNEVLQLLKVSDRNVFDKAHGFIATASPNSNLYESNTRYFLTRNQVLDATNYISFEGVQNSILDLSSFGNSQALDLEAVRVLRMGTNNEINGFNTDETTRANIITSGTLSIVDMGLYGNNWHLIEYDNGLRIEGVNFDLNAVDNYGLIRKRNSGVDGIDLEFKNNIFDLNFVPATPTRPLILGGAFIKLDNNQFDLLGTTNVSLLGGGISSTVSGGHVIIDNTFNGGGFIFSKLTDAFTNYDSKFIHNEFRQVGSLYAQPFHPNVNSENFLDKPKLNGSYFYKTACTNYEFNVGNYYEDWADSGWYNDTNGDGIHDSYNGIDYIERGTDFQGDPIRDFRSVTPYPFNFAGQTGNALSTYDTCQSFNFNIVQPQEQNYSSGHTLVSDWEFVSIAYPNMICFETLNGFTSIYENVGSGDNKGLEYDTTDGHGTFQVKCCDNAQCDNVVQESEVIEFNIGDGSLGDLIVQGVQTPTIVQGCTDPQANNYNPSATQDDGSCTYDNGNGGNGNQTGNGGTGIIGGQYEAGNVNILGNSIEETADNGVNFMKDLSNGGINLAIPIVAFLVLLFLIGGVIALIRIG